MATVKKKVKRQFVLEQEDPTNVRKGDECYWITNGSDTFLICVQGTPKKARLMAERIAYLLN